MPGAVRELEDLDKDELINLLTLTAGEALVHYGMWFCRTASIKNIDLALEAESAVFDRFVPAILGRLAGHLGFERGDGITKGLRGRSETELANLVRDIAKVWLASDGLWFQEMERRHSMAEAKEVNDSCWALFAPMEAFKLKSFLGLCDSHEQASDKSTDRLADSKNEPAPPHDALRALERALPLRIYSLINPHCADWENDRALVWKMIRCRVQDARIRKGLAHYPCRSAGVVEYTLFAQGIDPRITTECIVCPPDELPEGVACAWRFTL
jgi:hypothetical protein